MIYGHLIDQQEEVLNEIALYNKDKYKITIDGAGKTDRDFEKAPYIKIYDHGKPCVRIDMTDGHIIQHIKKVEALNSSEKKKLKSILSGKPIGADDKLEDCETVWKAAIKANKILANDDNLKSTNFNSIPNDIGWEMK